MTAEALEAIARYEEARLSPAFECAEKVDAVAQLGALLPDPIAREFLLKLLRTRGEYDLARVEVCRLLETHTVESLGGAEACIDALLQTIEDDEDALVSQWAARALRTFAFSSRVVECALRVARREGADLDTRHNALVAVEGRIDSELANALRSGLLAERHN
jgi:hypothetical protein